MEIRESVTFEQVRAEAKTIWYAVGTCWWTHKPEDVREATIIAGGGKDSIPLDPSGSPFHEYEPVVAPPVYDDQKIVARCIQCNAEFTEAQTAGHDGCPACGNEGLPSSPEQDVTVKINWHELRIICIWAENYANSIAGQKDVKGDPVKSVWAIASRLQEQYPSFVPLTLSGEIGQLREQFKDIEVHGIREGGPVPPKIS